MIYPCKGEEQIHFFGFLISIKVSSLGNFLSYYPNVIHLFRHLQSQSFFDNYFHFIIRISTMSCRIMGINFRQNFLK